MELVVVDQAVVLNIFKRSVIIAFSITIKWVAIRLFKNLKE